MKYVFGPVPSRRLGRSLGIDPVLLKTCNWNCVYCQLGRTRPLTNVRREYIPRHTILAEIQQALIIHRPGEVDWITFVGSGEPTLHRGLGWLICQVKKLTDLPVAVITNGSLLSDPDVCAELLHADAVLPSLDAGNPVLFKRLNRPWPSLTFDRYLNGLRYFRQLFHGKLWVEVMLVRGVNDTQESLIEIASALQMIEPDQVHLTLPERPPSETWVLPSDEAGVNRATAILGNVASVILLAARPFRVYPDEELNSAILGIITRHPMQKEELYPVLSRWGSEEIRQALESLQNARKAKIVVRHGKQFWSAAGAFYAGEEAEGGGR